MLTYNTPVGSPAEKVGQASKRTGRRKRRLTLVVGAALIFVGCGGETTLDASDEQATTSSAPDPTTAPSLLTTTTSFPPTASTSVEPGGDGDPESTLNTYIAAYNSGDVEEVMTVFSEESEIVDHPFSGLVAGLDEIRSVHVDEFEFSAAENAYTVSNVEVVGDTVTWDHEWVNAGGVSYCIEGNTAVVEEGKILIWTWANGGVAREC
jgi:hypothetical protein